MTSTAPYGAQAGTEDTDGNEVASAQTTLERGGRDRLETAADAEAFVRDPLFPFVIVGICTFIGMIATAWLAVA